jgi:hypothetical protein
MASTFSGDQRPPLGDSGTLRPRRQRNPRLPDPTGPILPALAAAAPEAGGLKQRWSITLASSRIRRPRWLTENGGFSSDPAKALRMVNPDVAVRRLHNYLKLRGWPTEAMERFRLVPAPGPMEARQPGRSGMTGSQAA